QTRFALDIRRGLSLVAFHDPNAMVRGLKEFPRDEWPPVPVVHVAFQVMVALGSTMALVAIWAAGVALRRKRLHYEATDRRLLLALTVIAPFGFLATEPGWVVAEVGRERRLGVGRLKP